MKPPTNRDPLRNITSVVNEIRTSATATIPNQMVIIKCAQFPGGTVTARTLERNAIKHASVWQNTQL